MTKWLAVACLFVVAIAASAEAAHFHPAGSASTKSCPICIAVHHKATVAHSASRVAQPNQPVTAVLRFESADFSPAATCFALFTRPPPAV